MTQATTLITLTPAELDAVARRAAVLALAAVAKESGELMSAKHVCEHLDIDRRTLNNWQRAGKLLPVSPGRYRRSDVLALTLERVG